MKLVLHSDPAVRDGLPSFGTTLRFLAATWVVVAASVVASSVWADSRYAALVTVLPVGYLMFLANRLAATLESTAGRFWRVLGIGLALVASTFVTIGLRSLVEPDVLFVLLGLLAPSAIFFLAYGLWLRLQASFGRPSSLGFFDVVLVVAVGLAYVSFLLTSDVFLGAGQGYGIGVFILVSCCVILLMAVLLVSRRRREPGGGVGVEVVFAAVLALSVAAVVLMFVWELVSRRTLLDVPAWLLTSTWTFVFSVALLAPYAEDSRRSVAAEAVGGVRPHWPYLLLALTPPIAIGSLISTQQQQKVAGVVGLLLVVEVLVVRQLVLIDEQRRARVRQHELRELATIEAARTNVILALALTLARHDDPRAMCDAVAAAVAAIEEGAAVAVFGRLEDGSVAVASRDVDDPGTMYAMLGQLRLTSSRCVRVSGPWFGEGSQRTALVSAVMGAAGDRLGYVTVVPAELDDERPDLVESIGGVADQLALALDRAGLLDAVTTETARVRESVDRLGEGVAVVGADDRVRACNAAFARMLGVDAGDVIGAPLPPRLLARLPVVPDSAVSAPGDSSWTSEVDLGTVDAPLPLRVSVFLSQADPLDDGVVVVIDDATPRSDERERLTGLLDDLVGVRRAGEPTSAERETAVAHELARGLHQRVEAPLAGVDAALAGGDEVEVEGLAGVVSTARVALRALYTDAAREMRA